MPLLRKQLGLGQMPIELYEGFRPLTMNDNACSERGDLGIIHDGAVGAGYVGSDREDTIAAVCITHEIAYSR